MTIILPPKPGLLPVILDRTIIILRLVIKIIGLILRFIPMIMLGVFSILFRKPR